jgi:predicted AAA+ superfamily ATPase
MLEDIVADALSFELPKVIRRDAALTHKDGFANVVIGMRRVGKTYLLYQKMQDLIDNGVARDCILYINFADDRLYPYEGNVLNDILEAFYAANPKARTQTSYIFFDEIQEVPEWGRFCRRLLDTEKAQLYVTGSSSKMMSSEVATEFRGRSRETLLLPLSFKEFLRFAGKETGNHTPNAVERSMLKFQIQKYMDVGGFPGVQNDSAPERIALLQNYFDVVLARDIMEHGGYTNVSNVRYFFLEALRSSGKLFSVNKIYNTMRSLGLKVTKEKLYSLKSDLIDAHAIAELEIFSPSDRKRSQSAKKIYSADHGLTMAMSHASQNDIGQRFETAVYTELVRRDNIHRDGEIAYYNDSDSFEVDFIVGDMMSQTPFALYQVAASLDSETTREREYRSSNMAMERFGLDNCTLITFEREEDVELKNGTLHIVPAWRWFTER